MNNLQTERISTNYSERHNVSIRQIRFFNCTVYLTGLLIAILIALTPPGVDDLLFLLPAKGLEPSPSLWSMMTGEFPRIWATQSGRLGNFLAMPMLYLVPKWIFGFITGGLITLLIFLSCRLAGAIKGSIVSWLLYATIILAYPWYDYLTMVTYGVNYIWAAAACAGAIACFLKIKSIYGIRLIAVCLLMFVAGWMHEGFGAPMTAGLTLSLILHHKEIDRRQVFAWICSCLGTGMILLSPMFWRRRVLETTLLMKYTHRELLMQLGPMILFIIAMTFIILWVAFRSKSGKSILTSSRSLIFTGAAFAATAVCIKYFTGARTGAPAILFSSLACGYLLTEATYRVIIPKGIKWTIGLLTGGFSIIHLVYADISQISQTHEYEEVTRLYEQSPDGTFHYDLTYPKADLTLFKTSVRLFHERVSKEFMRMYFNPEHKMAILPTELEGFTPAKAEKSQMTPGAMIYKGWAILPDGTETESFHRIHVLTETGEYLPSRFRTDRFESPGYGYFILITPHIKVLDPELKIRDIALSDHSR